MTHVRQQTRSSDQQIDGGLKKHLPTALGAISRQRRVPCYASTGHATRAELIRRVS